jgi:hypothetical protein
MSIKQTSRVRVDVQRERRGLSGAVRTLRQNWLRVNRGEVK